MTSARQSIELPGFGHHNPIPAACRKGPFLFSSGFVGRDPATGELPPLLDTQVTNVFAHIEALMAEAGGSPGDIVRVTVLLAEFREREALNREWLRLFPDPFSRPARQVIKAEFDAGILVQADIVAVLD